MDSSHRNSPPDKTGIKNKFAEMSNFRLISLTALFLVIVDNFAFFKNVTDVYPVSVSNIVFLISITVVLTSVIILLLSLFCFKYTNKPILIIILLVSSIVSYFMNHYNIVIDDTMIQNIAETDSREAFDLLNPGLLIYLVLAGILPSFVVYKIKIRYKPFKRELLSSFAAVIFCLTVMAAAAFPVGDFYSSFLREHKPLRYYTNPTYYIFSICRYFGKHSENNEKAVKPIGTDAKIPETDTDRELIIMVVGEALRSDRLSLNGYPKETTPLLEKEDIINFPNMYSCGTTTSVSVPCMFSIFTRSNYTSARAESTYNILDILNNAGVNILWRDNNSSSKGVAVRVAYEDYKIPETNTVCDSECRDEGMLVGLRKYIDRQETGDILIILHQMGNHGPAYYKRYPEAFEKFKPACKTSEFGKCSKEEISNAYDNATLYTDYFLSKVIALLKEYSVFESAMLYISDHGESLGEGNVYLHGLPYFMAPDSQKHIPAIMWFGDGFKIDRDKIRKITDREYSQDNIFHTLLGLMEVETSVYNKDMDILNIAGIEE